MPQVSKKTLKIRGELMDLSVPRVMGILNVTPDSFYSGSRFLSLAAVLDRVGEMEEEGAQFVDVGGYSTRPGAEDISVAEECERIGAIIEPINKNFPNLIISIDTFRSEVARLAVECGADMVNDVSGGLLDVNMVDTVAALGVPYVLMHMRGNPQTMSQLTDYRHIVMDVIGELNQGLNTLRASGISDIMIDPGFGFAKTIEQNFELINDLSEFHLLGCPLLVGISRKATIYRTLRVTAGESMNGTTVLNTIALQKGASILRVHDVKPAVEAIKLWMAVGGVN
ncbi:dihydropteroate synthase [Dyadobacter sp. 32]|uniref:dihydropteroate synthase n=1 Tax=Dyadobacter sp. 32 TaxID=538966 RepID=UPI0011EEC795